MSVATNFIVSHANGLLSPGSVDIWIWDLDPASTECCSYAAILSDEEKARACRFHLPIHRQKFVVSRAIVRNLLGSYLACDAVYIKFSYGHFGKPFVQDQPGKPSVRFSLSHTSRLGALAVSANDELGLDIEEIRPIEREVARSLSEREQKELAAMQANEWLLAFYHCWTRKEAILKAEGVGLSLNLDTFDVSVHPGLKPELLGSRRPAVFTSNWQMLSLQPAFDHVGAIALRSATTEVKYRYFDHRFSRS